MAIKKIMVPLDGSKSDTEVLNTALVMADRFGAHVEVLHVMPRATDTAPFTFARLPVKLKDTVVSEAERDSREKADAIQVVFETCCAKYNVPIADKPTPGVTASWHEEQGRASEVLVPRARLSDMVAIARPRRSGSTVRRSPAGETLEAVMLQSGRPVLIVPPEWQATWVEHAAIGWNESLEVSRALAMTLPCLPFMKTVTIIVSTKREASAKALVEYLAWHGIEAEIQVFNKTHGSVGEIMLDLCVTVGAGLLIVGGFSHARAREMLFGGVTRYLLAHANVLTAMVH